MSKIAPRLTDYLDVAVSMSPEQFRPMDRELRALKAVVRAAEVAMSDHFTEKQRAQGRFLTLRRALTRARAAKGGR